MQLVNISINFFDTFLKVASSQLLRSLLYLLIGWKPFSSSVQPSFISSNDGVEKFISMEFVAQKLLPGLHSIQLVLVCQLFWDPPRGQFPVSQGVCADFI